MRWFGHVKRKCPDAPVRSCERSAIRGFRRDRDGPKKNWGEVIRQDITQFQLSGDTTLYMKIWRSMIRVKGY